MARKRPSRRKRAGAEVLSKAARRRKRRRKAAGGAIRPSPKEFAEYARKLGFPTAAEQRQPIRGRRTAVSPDYLAFLPGNLRFLDAGQLRAQRDTIKRELKEGRIAGEAGRAAKEALETIRVEIGRRAGGTKPRRKGSLERQIPKDPTGEEAKRIHRMVKALPQSKRKRFETARAKGMRLKDAFSEANRPQKGRK